MSDFARPHPSDASKQLVNLSVAVYECESTGNTYCHHHQIRLIQVVKRKHRTKLTDDITHSTVNGSVRWEPVRIFIDRMDDSLLHLEILSC